MAMLTRRRSADGGAAGADLRDQFIARVVQGKTFADVGGLWGAHGEKVSVAVNAGAAKSTMIDILPEDSEWWGAFRDRMQSFGIDHYECVRADIHTSDVGRFDVVHSSGILYHLASPAVYLDKLREIAKQYVILTSAIIPRWILNRHGLLYTPDSSPRFVPGLSEREKRIYTKFYTGGDRSAALGGVTEAADFWTGNYSAWWWLLPPPMIRRMCEACGYEIVADGPNWNGRAHTFLLRNSGRKDKDPIG